MFVPEVLSHGGAAERVCNENQRQTVKQNATTRTCIKPAMQFFIFLSLLGQCGARQLFSRRSGSQIRHAHAAPGAITGLPCRYIGSAPNYLESRSSAQAPSHVTIEKSMIQTLFGSVEQEPTLLEKLKSGVQKTRDGLVSRIEDVISGRKEIDAELLDELEYTLISADIGVTTTNEILERIRERVDRKLVGDAAELRGLIREYLLEVLQANDRPLAYVDQPPAVIMVVGVNGAGKTTTIGKLAAHLKADGHSVLLCAADTFRAAAVEQLEIWGERTQTQVIRQNTGADPSAVMFDALQAAKSRKIDYLIVDTAGRLQTKTNLMAELEKMRRTASRIIPDAPHEVLLVLDATTGQNGLEQARKFTETSGVTGIVLTKLDGTAKGGVVVAIARELALPIRFVGVGEKVDDLLPFDPEKFIDSLFAQ
jgi:fused signal recognition particle receptor